ncbi:MAG: indolepyruvate ferredoxin oxidoreductase family protein [Hyphomicrobiaceae bacterium]|nr:indolepyruvate ferredoxin oxidoreductase family protein [Hyphomicrobiaceae bacterium]
MARSDGATREVAAGGGTRVSLGDKYDLDTDRVFLSGTQAIIRLMLMRQARDRAAGLDTAGYISGYRGSPLGGLDQQFDRARSILEPRNIKFAPGINEDIAATALWGTQQAQMRGDGRFDGVFGIWYGKGPGVDRSGDAFKHANLAGTAPTGGVIALMGDDHTCESSTTAHQSEFAFVDAMMPVLSPAGVQEILDYGLIGWELSRFAGVWVGLKCVKDTVESTASVDGRPDRVATVVPADFSLPPGGLAIRPSDTPLAMEERLHRHKLPAVLAFLAANGLDRIVVHGGAAARVGVVSVGKSWLDVLQALDELGLDEAGAAALGLRLMKVACPWPLEPAGIRRFAEGLELIIVVEEKRGLIEPQLKDILYGTASPPQVIGKRDEGGAELFASHGALDANDIAIAIGRRLMARQASERVGAAIGRLEAAQARLRNSEAIAARIPYFCPGCPHNSSTKVPAGHKAYAGIGCHYMVQWMDRATEGYTQMGGEGGNWIGEAEFSNRRHVFQNIGDGTYNHSGYLAIRAARAAGVNITYKILFNDAVAMTGGQRHDGNLSVPDIARQVAAEGAARVAIVSDEPDKYPPGIAWPPFTTFRHRSELDAVQRELAEVAGLSVLIYDQTCAAEKRRRRKRGAFPDPDRRVVINELVCEGCGDCGVQSNCVGIVPVETEFGRKRQIDQGNCNKDFSCVEGFCPSFVTVHGARPKRGVGVAAEAVALLEPAVPALDRVFGVIVTGIGGTGVVTIGQILGMAAHVDGVGAGVIDMAGLAQKGGAVTSHIRLAPRPEDIRTIRVAAGGADVVIGCDLVVTGGPKTLGLIEPGKTMAFVNSHETMTGNFTREADYVLPAERLKRAIRERAGVDRVRFVEASRVASALTGEAIAANMFMLGLAWQAGTIPLSGAAIREAIRLNGAQVELNLSAFEWGRRYGLDPEAVARLAERPGGGLEHRRLSADLDEMVERRARHLAAYQNAAYAERYRRAVATARAAEAGLATGTTRLGETVARYLFKLMAIKDEYEVARLYSDGSFAAQLDSQFSGYDRLEYHLAPPLLARRDATTGEVRKQRFGAWIGPVFRVLARLKGLRGTALDPFGATAERRMERGLRDDYQALVERIAGRLTRANLEAAARLLAFPEGIRGYGHVKERHVAAALAERERLLAAFEAAGDGELAAAAE